MTTRAETRSPAADERRVRAARNGVAVAFAVNGVLFATWLSRLPAIRDALGLTPSRLGLILLGLSVGAVAALPLSGVVVHRLGAARTVVAGALLVAAGLLVAGFVPGALGLAAVLFVIGVGTSSWDVAMNVEAAGVEQALGRPIMPRFHAGFSLGAVGGALLGAAAAAAEVSIRVHFTVLAVCGAALVMAGTRRFLTVRSAEQAAAERAGSTHTGDAHTGGTRTGSSGVVAAWREPRTLLVGLFVLGMAFAEGSANDWLALALVDGYDVSHAGAAVGYGVFVAAMTLVRLVGPSLLERFGRVRTLRWSAVLVLVGVLLVVLGPAATAGLGEAGALMVAGVGALAWGAGAALGFPVGMSAASDDPASAAARVSVVSTIGYLAFLAGPPVLGLLGDRMGIVRALLAVFAAVVLSLLCVRAVRPLEPQAGGGAGDS